MATTRTRYQRMSPFEDERIDLDELGDSAALVQEVAQSRVAKIVLDGGEPIAAIVDAKTYRASRMLELRRQLKAAAAEADAGNTIPHEQVLEELRNYFGGRVPDSMLKAFDEV